MEQERAAAPIRLMFVVKLEFIAQQRVLGQNGARILILGVSIDLA